MVGPRAGAFMAVFSLHSQFSLRIRRVGGGDHAAVIGGTAEAIEHFPGGVGDLGNCVFSVFLAAQVSRHYAEYEWAIRGINNAGVVANRFQFAGLVGGTNVVGQAASECGVFVRAEHLQQLVRGLLVDDLGAVDGFEQLHQLARRGDVFAAFFGGVDIHHFATQPGLVQAERIQHGVDVFHAHAIDQDIGGAVVADGNDHGGEVAVGDAGDTGREPAHDVAIGDEIFLAN